MKDKIDDLFSINSLIIDPGTYAFKAGLSGEENPSCIIESFIAKPKYKRILANEDAEMVGKPQEFIGLYNLKKFFSEGLFKNTQEVKAVFSKIFSEVKASQPLKETPVLITEALFTPLAQKIHLAKFLFETNNVPKVFFATQPVLSLYASGKIDGLVIESGDTFTQIVPVYSGYKIDRTASKVNFGGLDVTLKYKNLLTQGNSPLSHVQSLLFFDEIKKATLELMPAQQSSFDASSLSYGLPDGNSIHISAERFNAAEIIFRKHPGDRNWPGLVHLIEECGNELDRDLQRNLYRSIHLGGGNTMIKNFPERLTEELHSAFKGKEFKINVSNDDRSLLSWKGASLISHLSSFNNMWITKKDMEEVGERIFLSKML